MGPQMHQEQQGILSPPGSGVLPLGVHAAAPPGVRWSRSQPRLGGINP